MILSFLFWALVAYLAYRLIFDFIVPIYRTTRQVKKGFREMHERMNQMHQEPFQQQSAPKTNGAGDKNSSNTAGEYIDFEEIKD